MQRDIERFLRVLETERGFSVNTIFAYRNDLTQFLAFLRGEEIEVKADGAAFPPPPDRMVAVERWNQLTDDDHTNYLLYLRRRK